MHWRGECSVAFAQSKRCTQPPWSCNMVLFYCLQFSIKKKQWKTKNKSCGIFVKFKIYNLDSIANNKKQQLIGWD